MRRCGDSNSRVTHSSRKALNPFAEKSLTMASPFDSELGAVVITSLSWDWIPQICKRTPTCINAFNQLGICYICYYLSKSVHPSSVTTPFLWRWLRTAVEENSLASSSLWRSKRRAMDREPGILSSMSLRRASWRFCDTGQPCTHHTVAFMAHCHCNSAYFSRNLSPLNYH